MSNFYINFKSMLIPDSNEDPLIHSSNSFCGAASACSSACKALRRSQKSEWAKKGCKAEITSRKPEMLRVDEFWWEFNSSKGHILGRIMKNMNYLDRGTDLEKERCGRLFPRKVKQVRMHNFQKTYIRHGMKLWLSDNLTNKKTSNFQWFATTSTSGATGMSILMAAMASLMASRISWAGLGLRILEVQTGYNLESFKKTMSLGIKKQRTHRNTNFHLHFLKLQKYTKIMTKTSPILDSLDSLIFYQ